jgi:formate dehydrogenase subunit gamma
VLDNKKRLEQLIESYRTVPGGLLPLLHEVKATYGYVPDYCVKPIAVALNLSVAEVNGVISFYHDFNTQPVGKNVVQICRAEACQSMGSRDVEDHAKHVLGIDYGETTKDGMVTLEPVYCLGNCACSPSVRINDDIHARVDQSRLEELINDLQNTVTVTAGAAS